VQVDLLSKGEFLLMVNFPAEASLTIKPSDTNSAKIDAAFFMIAPV
jgi:hypothetical protein